MCLQRDSENQSQVPAINNKAKEDLNVLKTKSWGSSDWLFRLWKENLFSLVRKSF